MAKQKLTSSQFQTQAQPLLKAIGRSANNAITESTTMESVHEAIIALEHIELSAKRLRELIDNSDVEHKHGGILS